MTPIVAVVAVDAADHLVASSSANAAASGTRLSFVAKETMRPAMPIARDVEVAGELRQLTKFAEPLVDVDIMTDEHRLGNEHRPRRDTHVCDADMVIWQLDRRCVARSPNGRELREGRGLQAIRRRACASDTPRPGLPAASRWVAINSAFSSAAPGSRPSMATASRLCACMRVGTQLRFVGYGAHQRVAKAIALSRYEFRLIDQF